MEGNLKQWRQNSLICSEIYVVRLIENLTDVEAEALKKINYIILRRQSKKMMNEEINEKVLRYETFINDVLKEDLKEVHDHLQKKNTEMAEWIQLKAILCSFKETDMTEGFKTKMDVGTNVYVQVNVPDATKILINIGLGVYVEYTVDEALKFIEKRIDLLNKQIALIKGNSAQIKARIKLVIHGIQELCNIK